MVLTILAERGMRLPFFKGMGLAGVALVSLATVAASARAETTKLPTPPPAVAAGPVAKAPAAYTYGHVYLFRGIGNFLSRGIDTFDTELEARGVPVSIYNHRLWPTAADEIVAGYRTGKNVLPIVIIGHSLGANSAILLSNFLGEKGVPVRLVVTFDHVLDMPPLANNAAELIDYYKPPFGQPTKVAPDFAGPVAATNLEGREDVTHDSIDKTPAFHKVVLDKIIDILKKKPKGVAKG
jgi:hypothetical protein